MVVEKLIRKKEAYYWESYEYIRCFYSQYEYWYDGRLLLIGCFSDGKRVIVDAETGVFAVFSAEVQRRPTIEMLIFKFKEKLCRSGKTIHEVVRDYKINNLGLELWVVNSMII